MAYHLRRASAGAGGTVLALVGALHAPSVRRALAGGSLGHPFARVRRPATELRHLAPRSLTALLPDPPLAHAVWERVRNGHLPPEGELAAALSRRVSVVRFGWSRWSI